MAVPKNYKVPYIQYSSNNYTVPHIQYSSNTLLRRSSVIFSVKTAPGEAAGNVIATISEPGSDWLLTTKLVTSLQVELVPTTTHLRVAYTLDLLNTGWNNGDQDSRTVSDNIYDTKF